MGEGKKRSAPGRAASRSRRAARGDSLRWGDPPLIDLPALAFPSTNVIARRSVSPGGRSRFRRSPLSRLPGSGSFGECRFHLPGCPDRLPRRAVSTSPVARIGFPSCRFRLPGCPDRLPRRGQLALPGCPVRPPRPGRFRLPGCPDRRPRPVVTLPQTPGFPGTQCGCAPTADHLPYLPRFHLVRPVGPPPRPPLPLRVSGPARNRSSASGWRALTGMRTLCRTRFPWSRGIFGPHRVLPRNVALVTEFLCSSTVRTQVVHRPRVDASVFSGLNVRRDAAAPRHDHHHLLAHVGPDADVRSEPPLRAALSFPPHVTPTKGALP